MALSGDHPGQAIPNQEDEDPFVSLLGLEDKYQLISLSKYRPTFVVRLLAALFKHWPDISIYLHCLLYPAFCIFQSIARLYLPPKGAPHLEGRSDDK
jgi:hypothetical protein